jgi:hypothetical protein
MSSASYTEQRLIFSGDSIAKKIKYFVFYIFTTLPHKNCMTYETEILQEYYILWSLQARKLSPKSDVGWKLHFLWWYNGILRLCHIILLHKKKCIHMSKLRYVIKEAISIYIFNSVELRSQNTNRGEYFSTKIWRFTYILFLQRSKLCIP